MKRLLLTAIVLLGTCTFYGCDQYDDEEEPDPKTLEINNEEGDNETDI